ncbi:E3 ubiquitin-protein ligase MIB2 [Nymphon striatum]|nr:E3 ubiquitin-protein ligase MIB2 [Nymphon striatum]
MQVGLRVVRGPDWKWGNQDDGEGHIGTVVEVGKPRSKTTPDKTVVVQWDSGARTNYRVGFQDAHDLRIFDNAQIGIKHPNIICDSCHRHGIAGIRWKCSKCFDFDLCTPCFMADKHDLSHPFKRYEDPNALGSETPKRQGMAKVQSKGIFVGAKVARGPDWDWGNQDGGEGKIGKVIDIHGWGNESERSVAKVKWPSGFSNVYRCGHKGRIDLKYIQEGPGGYYYRDFLPILGYIVEVARPPVQSVQSTFKVDDDVKVLNDSDAVQRLQEGHGGWNFKMAEHIGMVGKVHRVTDKGDIRVKFEGSKNRWTFHPAALNKIRMFSISDEVKVIEDIRKMKQLQQGHGEWIDAMETIAGKKGKISKTYVDGDVRVDIGNETWTLNPFCLNTLRDALPETNNSMVSHEREDRSSLHASDIGQLMEKKEISLADQLVKEAASGSYDVVKELITKYPDKINERIASKSALQVACHQGHKDIAKMLLDAGADLEIEDADGDRSIHYSAFGNQPEVLEILLQRGANVNVFNNGLSSPLHISVNKNYVNCVDVLIRFKCDLNIQDSYGDTALHDAISKDFTSIVNLLVDQPEVDLTIKNKRGFNTLHYAGLKGNKFAIEKILSRSQQLADIKKDDGFAALHLSALNGHLDVSKILIEQACASNSQCDLNMMNNRLQTPLLLAVSQAHWQLAEFFILKGATINMIDEDGDTALHLALMHVSGKAKVMARSKPSDRDKLPPEKVGDEVKKVSSQLSSKGFNDNYALAFACFLLQKYCDINCKNKKGEKAFDLISDADMLSVLYQFISKSNDCITEPGTSCQSEISKECYICTDAIPNVFFEPCGHRITCQVCSLRMKRCVLCQRVILKKIGPGNLNIFFILNLQITGGRLISTKGRDASAERVTYLENKIQEIQEAHTCSICMERSDLASPTSSVPALYLSDNEFVGQTKNSVVNKREKQIRLYEY